MKSRYFIFIDNECLLSPRTFSPVLKLSKTLKTFYINLNMILHLQQQPICAQPPQICFNKDLMNSLVLIFLFYLSHPMVINCLTFDYPLKR